MIAWLIALQFLTRLPVRLAGVPTPQQQGRSLLWYPLVGLLIGGLLSLSHWLLGATPASLQAALLLTLWVGLSGGLHLDGLADSADAWAGGYGDRERSLAIMQDPRSGPIAVVLLVLVLLLKYAALVSLLEAQLSLAPLALLLVPMLGRAGLLALFLTTAYVRPGGLGQMLATYLPRIGARRVLLLSVCGSLLLGGAGLLALLLAAGLFILLRRLMLKRLGGTTGDTAGALVELLECALLLGLALG
ncbi:MAG: adenosylcobinamide-GDP ribazoletransferase [Pseudomonas sp.]